MRSDLALAALACAAVPGMKPVSVSGLGPTDEELDGDLEVQRALVEDATGREWVVHAPLNPVAGARLQRNDELVRQLSRHVPFKVPAPAGYAAVGKDGQAVVYPHVEGVRLDLARLPAGPGLSSAVGRAIAAVHNIPRGVFEEQDVPVFDAAGCRQRAIAVVDRAAETGRVPTGLLARWEEAFDAAALWQFASTPVHGDIRGSSLLLAFSDDQDASTGRVVAVLGWEEAMIADPAHDLAELYHQTTPQAWETVLESYSLARAQRPDPYLHARARLVAETRALHGLAHAVEQGAEDSVRRSVEALRRLDRLTEDDDSLVPTTARSRTAAAQATSASGEMSTAGDAQAWPPVDDVVAVGDDRRLHDLAEEEPLSKDAGLDEDEDPVGRDEEEVRLDEEEVQLAGQADSPTEVVSRWSDLDEQTIEVPTAAGDRAEGDAPDGGVQEAGGSDDLDHGERLHELYGMPEVDLGQDPDPGSDQEVESDAAAEGMDEPTDASADDDRDDSEAHGASTDHAEVERPRD